MVFLCQDCDQHESTGWSQIANYSWAHSFNISPKFYDIYFYQNVMNQLLSIYSNIQGISSQWFGSMFVTSTFGAYLNLSMVDEMLSDHSFTLEGVNVLAFADITRPDESLQSRLEDSLPGMYDILKYVLLLVGEDPEDITSMELLSPGFKAFHGDFFVSHPVLLRSYTDWLELVVRIFQSNETVQSMIRKSVFKNVLRTKIKALFPYIFRHYEFTSSPPVYSITNCLASYFFHRIDAKIVTITEYKTLRKSVVYRREEKHIADAFNAKTVQKLMTQ